MKRKIVILVPIIVVIAAAMLFGLLFGTATAPTVREPSGAVSDRVMDIDTYIRLHISDLSTVPEVLGGTFFVTDIHSSDGSGVVQYEDGHNAYVADFSYSADPNGGYSVTSFVVRR